MTFIKIPSVSSGVSVDKNSVNSVAEENTSVAKNIMRNHGFTLIEMMVVLTILALTVSLVAVNYREPVNNARLENAFETIERLDRRVRHWCKTNDTAARITVDLDRGVFTAENGNGSPLPLPEAKVPDGMKLKELRIMGENRFGRDTKIPYTTRGVTPGWAYSIVDSGGREKYRLIVGATGQAIPFDDEDSLIRFERLRL
jgi:prepilin-type N-terminal cleavage/methylation domain-containing protein